MERYAVSLGERRVSALTGVQFAVVERHREHELNYLLFD